LAKIHTIHCKDETSTAVAVKALSQAILGFYAKQPKNAASLFVSLDGDLGAGKTTATRHLLKAMGYGGKVKSPTYSLCEEHILQLPNHRELQVFHFDLYRMQNPSEWQEAGLLEHFDNQDGATLCIVEWPKKAEHTLPVMDLAITLMHSSDPASEFARTIDIAAMTPQGETIVEQLITP
jgi:tRNA threonylcarbamoyladenosine biosynthesis protein TsaE